MLSLVAIFLVGLILLIAGADFLIKGSSSLAKRLGFSAFFISLTIVSFGTSAPELTISFLSNLKGDSSLAMGNVIGSNITNVLLVLGLASIFRPLMIKKNTVKKEIPFSILSVLVLFVLTNDKFWGQGRLNYLSRADGLILLILFFIFVYYSFGIRNDNKKDGNDVVRQIIDKAKIQDYGPLKSSYFSLLGMILLFVGGQFTVRFVIGVSEKFNISQTFLGLTIVALGTSLPELTASVWAARKGQIDIAVGNVIGSNVVNLLFILGVCSLTSPMAYNTFLNRDLLFLLISNIILLLLSYYGGNYIVKRWEGLIMIFSYGIYLFLLTNIL